jgi:hypothetical protein
MDLDNFFKFFTPPHGEDTNKDNDLIASYSDFYDNPIYKLGMFKKLIINHQNFNSKALLSLLGAKGGDNEEAAKIQRFSDMILYNRAYGFLNAIDLEIPENVSFVKESFSKELIISFNLALKFFEGREEYERCALIKKFEDLVSL